MKREKEKLNRLIEAAAAKGIPISDNQEILAQSQRVDRLINEYVKHTKGNEPSR